MPPVDTGNPFALIGYALATAPDSLAALPVFSPSAPENDLIVAAKLRTQPIPPSMREHMAHGASSTNGSGTMPTHIQVGRALVILPTDVVKNIRGDQSKRDLMYVVVVRREVYERAASGLIVPAPSASRIVRP